MFPFGLYLSLKTHLQPITFPCGGDGTKVQVFVFSRAVYSTSIAWCQWGSCKACLTVRGSAGAETVNAFFLSVPVLDRVSMGWQLVLWKVEIELEVDELENGIWTIGGMGIWDVELWDVSGEETEDGKGISCEEWRGTGSVGVIPGWKDVEDDGREVDEWKGKLESSNFTCLVM